MVHQMAMVLCGQYDDYDWMRSDISSEIYRANNYMLWSHCSFNKECSGLVVECSSRDLEVLVRGSPGALCCALEQMFYPHCFVLVQSRKMSQHD